MKTDKEVQKEIARWKAASGSDCKERGYKGRPKCGGSIRVICR